MDAKPAGEQIRLRRLQLGWSQPDLADRCRLSVRQIVRIERGHCSKLATLSRVAAELGLTLNVQTAQATAA